MAERSVKKFELGQYVLLKYPKKPLDKLSTLYRGTMEIVAMDLPVIVKVRDLTMDKVSIVHTSKNWKKLAGIHVDEYFVEKIVDHEEQARSFKNWKFCV